jgi:hypothetical protein
MEIIDKLEDFHCVQMFRLLVPLKKNHRVGVMDIGLAQVGTVLALR